MTEVVHSVDANPWQEIEECRLFREHLDLSEGFALVVILAPDEPAIVRFREHMRQQILADPGAFQRVQFAPEKGIEQLAEALLQFEPDPSVRLVWVDADPVNPEQLDERKMAWRNALARLNRYRNSLKARLDCTLVIALPSRWKSVFRETAPDMWSIRSGVYSVMPQRQAARNASPALEALESLGTSIGSPGVATTTDPAETLAALERLRGKTGREEKMIELLERVGDQYRARFQWPEAIAALEEAFELTNQLESDPQESQAHLAPRLLSLYLEVADFEKAERYARLHLALAEANGQAHDSETAVALNNLAQVLKDTNRLEEAERLMRRALEIDEAAHGPEHPTVAIRLNNLAALLLGTNRLEESERLMHWALAIDEASHGPDHPTVALRLNNLAQLLKETNRLEEAEPLMRRALAIDEAAYGAEHPAVARHLNNLSMLLKETNRLEEAEPLMRRALAIVEAAYRADHPTVAISLNNLAQLLEETNRQEEAEPLMRRAYDILLEVLGEAHPKTKTARKNYGLGLLLMEMEKTRRD